MPHIHSDPQRAADPAALPNVEVFFAEAWQATETGEGWYWWPCFPGCLPDGAAVGPFETREAAEADAREGDR